MSAHAERKAKRLTDALERCYRKSVRRVENLFLPEGAADRNPDADKPWHEASTATRASIELTKGAMALERAKLVAAGGNQQRSIGLVILPARSASIDEWETAVRERNAKAIDTTVGPALLEVVKK